MTAILRHASCLLITVVAFTLFAPWHLQAHGQNAGKYDVDPAMNVGNPKRTEELNRLYKRLRESKNIVEAQGLSSAIWVIWLHHGDPKIDALMDQAITARGEANFARALELLGQVIEADPGYAEGWNQRAIIYFARGDYEESLKDVAETLKREPNHFGAMAGRGVIRYRQGKSGLAIQGILEALKAHPWLNERQILRELGYEEA